jgi:hypothetical protein
MRRNILTSLITGMLLIVGTETAWAQEITIDWATKKVTSQPTEIHKGETIKVSVSEVNNILYDYTIDIQLQITSNSDDLAALMDVLSTLKPPERKEKPNECQKKLDGAIGMLKEIQGEMKEPKNNLDAAAHPGKSIPLEDTLKGWKEAIVKTDELSTLQKAAEYLSTSCKSNPDAQAFLAGPYQQFDNFRKKVEGPHIAEGVAQASTGDVASVKVTVTEKSSNVQLDSRTWVLHFSSMLNLSGGVLFSTLYDVSYVRRKVPVTDGSGATTIQEQLGVEGGSRPVPMLLGLLNYRIPYLDSDKWGLDISSGPAIRLGGQSDTTSFGYFVGLSFNLWHRLYITPGVHVGQYADFPAGFAPDTPIPADFGELVPVKRWTARFAIGITYKTLDLGALKGQAKPSTPPKTEETKK